MVAPRWCVFGLLIADLQMQVDVFGKLKERALSRDCWG